MVPTSEKARDPERYDENEDSDSECEITDQQVISDNSNLPLRRSKRSRKEPDWLATPEIEREWKRRRGDATMLIEIYTWQ